MRLKTVQSESGFTLLEVLIAMAILSIGVFAVFAMQLRSTQGNTKANRLTVASSWNVNQLEQIISSQYDAATLTAGNHGPVVSPDGRYALEWTVAVDTPVQNAKTITVTVEDNNNSEIKVSYEYIKANF